MNLTVQMQGFDRLALKTRRLTDAAQTGLKFGVSEAAFIMQEEAKRNAPVKSGALRDSIHTETVTDEPEKQVLKVLPDTPYAARIEFGFVGADSLGRVYNQAPNPYMRSAFDVMKGEATEAIKNGVVETVQGAHR